MSNIILVSKEMLLLTGACLTLSKVVFLGKYKIYQFTILGICGLTILYVLIPSQLFSVPNIPAGAKIISARAIVTLPLLYLLGREAKLQPDQLNLLLKKLYQLGLFSVLVGSILTLMPISVWNALSFKSLISLKLGEATAIKSINPEIGFPISYFFPDLPEWIIPFPGIRRLSTTVIEPIPSGIILVTLYLLGSAGRQKFSLAKRNIGNSLLGLGAFLTLTRAAFLIALTSFIISYVKKPLTVFISGAILVAFVLFVYAFILPDTPGVAGTNRARIPALVSGIQQVIQTPLGRGLGTSGYLSIVRFEESSDLVTGDSANEVTAESFLSTIAVQIGLPGLCFFYALLIYIILRLYKQWQYMKMFAPLLAKQCLLLSGAAVGITIMSFLSASGYSFVGLGITFLMFGVFSNSSIRPVI